MLNKYYFAYGSNLYLKQMQERCRFSTPFRNAVLNEYELTFKSNKRGRGVADITLKSGSTVEGALYEVTEEDIKNLDRFEGHPRIYKRQNVVVMVDNKKVEAITYIMNSTFKLKAPEKDYLQKILNGYEDWGIPVHHLLKTVEKLKKEAM